MTTNEPRRAATRAALVATAAIAALPLATLLYVALSRLNFPWELEWLEGTCIAMARRFADGLPLYAEPSAQHVAAPYFPLYFVVTGLIFKLTGAVYWAGRLVSLLATLATGGLVFWMVHRTTKRPAAALTAMGMWFAAYGSSGFFYDLNRVDALAIFFLMAAYAAAFARPGAGGGAAAGLLLAASVMTKQNHIAFLPPIVFAQWLRRDRRGAAAALAVCLGAVGVAEWWLNRASDGWFVLLTMKIMSVNIMWLRAPVFFVNYWWHYPAALVVIVLAVVPLVAARRWRDLLGDPWIGFWLAGCAVSLVCQLPPGGYFNANMPAALGTALATGMALPGVAARLSEKRPRWGRPVFVPLAAAFLIFCATSSVKGQIPAPSQWVAAQKLHEFIRAQEGVVFIPGFLPLETNVIPFHEISLYDMKMGLGANTWKRPWLWKLKAELAAARPSTVISHGALDYETEYRNVVIGMKHEWLPVNLRVRTVTGKDSTLMHVYRRLPPAADDPPPANAPTPRP